MPWPPIFPSGHYQHVHPVQVWLWTMRSPHACSISSLSIATLSKQECEKLPRARDLTLWWIKVFACMEFAFQEGDWSWARKDLGDKRYKENKTQACDRVGWRRPATWQGGPGGRLSERQLSWELVRGGTSPAKAEGGVFQAEDGARAWPLRWDELDAEERQGVTPAGSDASPVLTGALCQCPQSVFSGCSALTDFLSSPRASLTRVFFPSSFLMSGITPGMWLTSNFPHYWVKEVIWLHWNILVGTLEPVSNRSEVFRDTQKNQNKIWKQAATELKRKKKKKYPHL